jgi:hypothetical protein
MLRASHVRGVYEIRTATEDIKSRGHGDPGVDRYNKRCCLVGDHMLLKDFGPYGIIFMNVFVVTVSMI